MKILSARQMQQIDQLTFEQAGVPSLTLMENAGRGTAEFLLDHFAPVGRVSILCGKGNNGGDALVVARHLLRRGHKPEVVLLGDAEALEGDARVNYEEFLKVGGRVDVVQDGKAWEARRAAIFDCHVLVDGLLGTGLAGPARGLSAQVISDVNTHRGRYRVLAVDIPSGLSSDSGDPVGESVRADACVTFTAPKRGHVFPPNCLQVGTLAVAPIGTPESLYADDPELFLALVTARQFATLPLARPATAHKGDFGHVMLVAGSRGKTGAAALAGKAALRVGAGLVTVGTASSLLPVVATPVPEMMTEPLAETETGAVSERCLDYGAFAKLLEGKSVLAMGPGLATHPETIKFVWSVLEQCVLPLVLDADALNALVGRLDLLHRRRSKVLVLTPHPGELARLLGTTGAEVQQHRIEVARNFAREYGLFVILKGFRTLVATPQGRVYVNPTGGPGLAKGGSGDVLTGMVAGALAQFQTASTEDALCLAVNLHGRAGDLAAESTTEQSVMASDIIAAISSAWRALKGKIESDDPGSYYVLP